MRKRQGFTLIELMVTIAVLAIILMLAVPSFQSFRQRVITRGAADEVVNFWGDARFVALRENRPVRVTFVSSGGMCMGATTGTAACNCMTAGSCNVASWPASQAEWRGARLGAATTLGAGTGTAVIDPKRGNITLASDAGRISLRSPAGAQDYSLDVVVDRNGRATVCEPASAVSKLPQFTERRC